MRRKCVLFVDDCAVQRMRFEDLCRKAFPKLQVIIVGTFEAAQDALASDTLWDLLVSDVCLRQDEPPDKLGIRLAELAWSRDLPCIVVTSSDKVGLRDIEHLEKDYRVRRVLSKTDETYKAKLAQAMRQVLVTPTPLRGGRGPLSGGVQTAENSTDLTKTLHENAVLDKACQLVVDSQSRVIQYGEKLVESLAEKPFLLFACLYMEWCKKPNAWVEYETIKDCVWGHDYDRDTTDLAIQQHKRAVMKALRVFGGAVDIESKHAHYRLKIR